jgi:hypothetical protein
VRLSADQVSHISNLLVHGAGKEGLVQYSDLSRILKLTKETLTHYVKMDEEIDAVVRKKIASYSRGIPEGSREWDVLYRKHFDEEMKKRWR